MSGSTEIAAFPHSLSYSRSRTPSMTLSPLARPPTNGGPLSSHPTTPIDMPGAWTSTTDLSMTNTTTSTPALSAPSHTSHPSDASTNIVSTSCSSPQVEQLPSRNDSLRTPLTPASAHSTPTSRKSGGKGVRKLLSLSSLRNSFASSRTSLAISTPVSNERERAPCPPSRDSEIRAGMKRTASETSTNTPAAAISPGKEHMQPPLRKKKSQSWFRRRSSVLFFGQDDLLDSVEEQQSRPEHQPDARPEIRPESRRQSRIRPESRYDMQYEHTQYEQKSVTPPPVLPKLEELNGGKLNGGSLDAEDMFASIGR